MITDTISGQLLSQAWEATNDGVAVVDGAGVVLFRNAAADRYLGGGIRCEFRRPGGEPVADRDAVHVLALLGAVAPRMDVAACGQILEVTATALPGGGTVVLVWRDVTAARRRAEALERFAAVLAHDLRNPLCTIESWSDLLEEALAGTFDEAARRDAGDALERIGRAAARIRTLIDDLLADATTGAAGLCPEPVALGGLVAEVAAGRVDLAVGTGGPVPRFTIGELPVVPGDPALLRQLLENLIGNAVKYTAPGMIPRVSVHAEEVAPGSVAVHLDDNGIGIPAGEREAVFDDFQRADGDGSRAGFAGFGLGLGICRRIVQRHGGTIRVAGNPGGTGSRFTVTLPAGTDVPAHPGRPDRVVG